MLINLVPRDGGNTFRGSAFINYTRGSWQGTNVDDELRAQGLSDSPKTLKLVDFNPTFGGPIVRDKLWFQSTFQYNENRDQVFGSYSTATWGSSSRTAGG